MADEDRLYANGIDGDTGRYPLQPVTIGEAAVWINGERKSFAQLQSADIKPNHRDGVSPTESYPIQS